MPPKKRHHWNGTYDSTEPLEACEFKTLNPKIGVYASRPIDHKGLQCEAIDVCFETISVNTSTAGSCVPADQWQAKVVQLTDIVLNDLDTVIAELQGHRDRLRAERLKLRPDEQPIWGNSSDAESPESW